MKGRRSIAIVAVILGVFAIVMAAFAFLALLDIAQGQEPDLMLEWAAVWIALVVVVVALVVSLAAIVSLLRGRRAGTGKAL
ncbi:MAG: hypothetical protein ABIG03_01340 [Candidatus Eisenbacteria bacterium]